MDSNHDDSPIKGAACRLDDASVKLAHEERLELQYSWLTARPTAVVVLVNILVGAVGLEPTSALL